MKRIFLFRKGLIPGFLVLAGLLCAACSNNNSVSGETAAQIDAFLQEHYSKQDKEVVARVLEISSGDIPDTCVVLVHLSWPEFAVLGKKVIVRVKKENEQWHFLSQEDL